MLEKMILFRLENDLNKYVRNLFYLIIYFPTFFSESEETYRLWYKRADQEIPLPRRSATFAEASEPAEEKPRI